MAAHGRAQCLAYEHKANTRDRARVHASHDAITPSISVLCSCFFNPATHSSKGAYLKARCQPIHSVLSQPAAHGAVMQQQQQTTHTQSTRVVVWCGHLGVLCPICGALGTLQCSCERTTCAVTAAAPTFVVPCSCAVLC